MDNALKEHIQNLITSSKVFLFMKGTPEQPQCGFSAQVVGILHKQNISFKSYNIFDNEDIRQGIKEFSNWPTIPQLFINGKFIGGCDIVTEIAASGELQELVK